MNFNMKDVRVFQPYRGPEGKMLFMAICVDGTKVAIPEAFYPNIELCRFVREWPQVLEGLYGPESTFWAPYIPTDEEYIEWSRANGRR